jgi:predicted metal-binding protein
MKNESESCGPATRTASTINASLVEKALCLGATAAILLPIEALVVEERFAAMCAAPHRCPSYGLAPGCPPHALVPAAFRESLRRFQQLLAFKIDAPTALLMGAGRPALARTIHTIASGVEQEAVRLGLVGTMGLAAGSCKELFCPREEICVVLEHGLPCPHAHLARPSISALGVNFSALAEAAGWSFAKIDDHPPVEKQPAMGLMAGLVVLPTAAA